MTVLLKSILFWLVISSGIAFWWPAELLGWDPFLSPRWLLWSLITLTMFCLGTLVRQDELGPLRSHPWWVVLGVAAQVSVMPIAAWLATQVVPMSNELAAGVILVGCVPGAMASNVLTHTAGGSVAYSVSLTTVATLISPLTVPLVLSLFEVSASASQLRPGQTSLLLVLTVVLPTVAGYLTSQQWLGFRSAARRWGSPVAAACLLWIIAGVVAGNRDKLAGVQPLLILALLVVNVVGYLAGYSLGSLAGLTAQFRRALTLEVGMQNAGLGTVLASTLYGSGTLATIPTAAYTFGCMLTGTILAVTWKNFGQDRGDGRGQAGPSDR